jgi:hypothetical protein
MIRIHFYMTLQYCIKILTKIGRALLGRNFDVANWRAACEACSEMY